MEDFLCLVRLCCQENYLQQDVGGILKDLKRDLKTVNLCFEVLKSSDYYNKTDVYYVSLLLKSILEDIRFSYCDDQIREEFFGEVQNLIFLKEEFAEQFTNLYSNIIRNNESMIESFKSQIESIRDNTIYYNICMFLIHYENWDSDLFVHLMELSLKVYENSFYHSVRLMSAFNVFIGGSKYIVSRFFEKCIEHYGFVNLLFEIINSLVKQPYSEINRSIMINSSYYIHCIVKEMNNRNILDHYGSNILDKCIEFMLASDYDEKMESVLLSFQIILSILIDVFVSEDYIPVLVHLIYNCVSLPIDPEPFSLYYYQMYVFEESYCHDFNRASALQMFSLLYKSYPSQSIETLVNNYEGEPVITILTSILNEDNALQINEIVREFQFPYLSQELSFINFLLSFYSITNEDPTDLDGCFENGCLNENDDLQEKVFFTFLIRYYILKLKFKPDIIDIISFYKLFESADQVLSEDFSILIEMILSMNPENNDLNINEILNYVFKRITALIEENPDTNNYNIEMNLQKNYSLLGMIITLCINRLDLNSFFEQIDLLYTFLYEHEQKIIFNPLYSDFFLIKNFEGKYIPFVLKAFEKISLLIKDDTYSAYIDDIIKKMIIAIDINPDIFRIMHNDMPLYVSIIITFVAQIKDYCSLDFLTTANLISRIIQVFEINDEISHYIQRNISVLPLDIEENDSESNLIPFGFAIIVSSLIIKGFEIIPEIIELYRKIILSSIIHGEYYQAVLHAAIMKAFPDDDQMISAIKSHHYDLPYINESTVPELKYLDFIRDDFVIDDFE